MCHLYCCVLLIWYVILKHHPILMSKLAQVVMIFDKYVLLFWLDEDNSCLIVSFLF